jgi:hypothetical protein
MGEADNLEVFLNEKVGNIIDQENSDSDDSLSKSSDIECVKENTSSDNTPSPPLFSVSEMLDMMHEDDERKRKRDLGLPLYPYVPPPPSHPVISPEVSKMLKSIRENRGFSKYLEQDREIETQTHFSITPTPVYPKYLLSRPKLKSSLLGDFDFSEVKPISPILDFSELPTYAFLNDAKTNNSSKPKRKKKYSKASLEELTEKYESATIKLYSNNTLEEEKRELKIERLTLAGKLYFGFLRGPNDQVNTLEYQELILDKKLHFKIPETKIPFTPDAYEMGEDLYSRVSKIYNLVESVFHQQRKVIVSNIDSLNERGDSVSQLNISEVQLRLINQVKMCLYYKI